MGSKACNRQRPWSFDVNYFPETVFHFPISPGEAGKFDFYRAYITNHGYFTDPTSFDCSDASTLPTSPSSIKKRREISSVDFVSSDESKSSTLTTSQSSNSISSAKSEGMSSKDSNVLSKTNSAHRELTHSTQSFPSLADLVKNVINKGHFSAKSNHTSYSFSGTTLSSKDLNHLSPQSM
ncbi:unnamed protein product [Rotaria sp. Silwood2]|nr:unnamed protein product [Rotaria sp. Silwood2]CAF4439149.1 unnamed protein product [Rotaria sp. Silwood2]CAF4455244.1 unnamed protein product [Rotaria sp. Silwood2]